MRKQQFWNTSKISQYIISVDIRNKTKLSLHTHIAILTNILMCPLQTFMVWMWVYVGVAVVMFLLGPLVGVKIAVLAALVATGGARFRSSSHSFG